jgi:uncharacterized NAD(P)/FAD-binding protein YdhS
MKGKIRGQKYGSIAIVGCGAAGIALMTHMSRLGWGETSRVLLIDPRPPGSGVAFDRDEEYLLCNTSVGVNSVFPDDPEHHLRWLQSDLIHGTRWGIDKTVITAHSYVPRGLFLAYLSEQFSRAIDDCTTRGIFIDYVPDKVVRVTANSDGAVVTIAIGDRFPVNRAFVCTGLQVSDDTISRCRNSGGIIWPVYQTHQNLDRLSQARRVLILGMRQSAIDSAQLVREYNPCAEIVMVSRTARFPAVRSEMVERPSAILTSATILQSSWRDRAGSVQRWHRLIREDMHRQDGHGDLFPMRHADPIHQLAADLEHSVWGNPAWQRIDRHAVTVANEVWPALSQGQRMSLQRSFSRHVRRYVSAVPDIIARRLLADNADGRLTCARAVAEPKFRDRGVSIDSDLSSINADVAIDATGLTAVTEDSRALTPVAIGHLGSRVIHHLGPANVNALAIPNYFNATARQAAALASSIINQATTYD